MMKKWYLLILLILVVLLTGCNTSSQINCFELSVSGNDWSSANEFDIKGEDDFVTNHIVQENLFDRDSILRKTEEHSSSADASESFRSLYNAADLVEVYPVWSMYLDYTDLAVATFYANGILQGAKIIDYRNATEDITEFDSDWTPNAVAYDPISDESCFGSFNDCSATYPDFQVFGVIFHYAPLSNIYLLGMNQGSTQMQYTWGSVLCDFAYVEPFDTVESGRQAYLDYLSEREEILKDVLVFPWQKETISYYGDWNYFINTVNFSNAGVTEEQMAIIQQCDELVCVPLLDMQGGEGVYQMYLLYYRNGLKAELVFHDTDPEAELVWYRVNTTDSENKNDSQYMISLQQAEASLKNDRKGWQVIGVAFDGTSFVPIAQSKKQVYHFDVILQEWTRAGTV